jgi:integrase
LGYAFILILNTGIRLGEALALRTRGDVDLKNKRMIIDSSMSFVKNRKAARDENKYTFVEVLPKTKTSKCSLPLNNAALDAAKKLLELNSKHKFLLSNSCGNFTEPRNLARTLKCILKKAGIAGCGIHTLRHTYASALFRKGEDVKIISTLLGHVSAEITQDTYIHLLDEQTNSVATN